jgi:hypothetical protein
VHFTNRKNAPLLFSTRLGTRPRAVLLLAQPFRRPIDGCRPWMCRLMEHEPHGTPLLRARSEDCYGRVGGDNVGFAGAPNHFALGCLDTHFAGRRVPALGPWMMMHRCHVAYIRDALSVQGGVSFARLHKEWTDLGCTHATRRAPPGSGNRKQPDLPKRLNDGSPRSLRRLGCSARFIGVQMPVDRCLGHYAQRLACEKPASSVSPCPLADRKTRSARRTRLRGYQRGLCDEQQGGCGHNHRSRHHRANDRGDNSHLRGPHSANPV